MGYILVGLPFLVGRNSHQYLLLLYLGIFILHSKQNCQYTLSVILFLAFDTILEILNDLVAAKNGFAQKLSIAVLRTACIQL